MRQLPANRGPVPNVFSTPALEDFDRRIESFLKDPGFNRPPEFHFRDAPLKEILTALQIWQRGKCAFCEVSADTAPRGSTNLGHFRPIRGADRGRKKVDRLHYCWLTTEWENYFIFCNACMSLKGNRFPLRRALAGMGQSLDVLRKHERPSLLDPSFDRIEKHLLVSASGEMLGITSRGQDTIDILNLNRSSLVISRTEAIQAFFDSWNLACSDIGRPELLSAVQSRLDANAAHCGAIALMLRSLLPQKEGRISFEDISAEILQRIIHKIGPIDRAAVDRRVHDRAGSYSEDRRAENRREGQTQPISRLVIHNFKGIRHAEFEFPAPQEKTSQWLTFVGANGIGKTTVLQALALGLVGPQASNEIIANAASLVTEGEDSGYVEVGFWYSDDVHRVTFEKDDYRFGGYQTKPAAVVGYGAYRLLARRTLPKAHRRLDFRLRTLFDDHVKINGLHGWFKKLKGRKLDDAADTVKQLMLAPKSDVQIVNRKIVVSIDNVKQPIDSLSSGLQNVVALATDILEFIYASKDSALSGRATVLIDELDAHLHPAWRLRIVERLRSAFPLVNFIFTTHDPLTLRGMRGVDVLRLYSSEEGKLAAHPPMPDIDGFFVDQLLTSDLFGLHTTMTEKVDGQFVRYYDLLAKPKESLTDVEAIELEGLSDALKMNGLMGATPRERILYRIIDRELASLRKREVFDEWSDETIRLLEEALTVDPEYREKFGD
ncbi:AAA family ATPase [Burkholderia pyrrocinia]|uniref:AAA family ATPase n=1 Tax=Burkholderia pyrrocinia TaxID=60550 RepID=UPI002AB10B36|nr:AAA family ATPase [Burkholderia pyrrocinia]